MTKKTGTTKSHAKDSDAYSAWMFDNVLKMQMAAFSSLAWLGREWAEMLGKMSTEFLQFAADRAREDVKFQHRCLHCKSAEELRRVQGAFIQKAIDQYAAETGKMIEIGSSVLTAAKKV